MGKGLFDSFGGKDEQFSSEDAFMSYSVKTWGYLTGDVAMEVQGILLSSANANQLGNFINKISGRFFENKIDRNTFFGITSRVCACFPSIHRPRTRTVSGL